MNTVEEILRRWNADLEAHFALSELYPLAASHCPDRVRANEKLMEKSDTLWAQYRTRKDDPRSTAQDAEAAYRETSRALLLWGIDLAILLEDVAPIAGFTVGWLAPAKQDARPACQEDRQRELSIF